MLNIGIEPIPLYKEQILSLSRLPIPPIKHKIDEQWDSNPQPSKPQSDTLPLSYVHREFLNVYFFSL